MKKKNGFTLIELIIVIGIVASVSVIAIVSYNTVDNDTAKIDLKNKYLEIQRAAGLYLDLNSDELNWFIENGSVDIRLGDLKNQNYISTDLINPVTQEEISENYFVRFCIKKDSSYNEYVDSDIIQKGSTNKCISNHYGEEKSCGCI